MKQICAGSGGGTNLSGSSTSYVSPVCHPALISTNEFRGSSVWPVAGTFGNLVVKVETPPGAGKSWTFTLRVNASDTSVVVTISDSATSGSSANTAAITAGQKVTIKAAPTNTPANTNVSFVLEHESTNTGESGYVGSPTSTQLAATTKYEGCFCFVNWGDSAPINVAAVAGNITAMYLVTDSSPGSGKSRTLTIYKNGVAQDGSGGTVDTRVTIADSATSANASFTLSVAAGDTFYTELISTNTPALARFAAGIAFTATTEGESQACGYSSSYGVSADRYSPVISGLGQSATESGVYRNIAPLTTFTLKKLQVVLSGAPGSSKSITLDGRNNSGSPGGTPTVTISNSNTSGSDASGMIQITASVDPWNVRTVPAGTPTSSQISWCFVMVMGAIPVSTTFPALTVAL